jgi:hypothetical protein
VTSAAGATAGTGGIEQGELEWVAGGDTVIENGGNAHLRRCRYQGGDFLLKQFTPEYLRVVDESALAALVGWRDGLPALLRAELDQLAAWPRAVVRHDGALCGVLIPFAGDAFLRRDSLGRRTPRSVYDLGASRTRRAANLDEKLRTLGHCVAALLWMHRHGVVVNDVQPGNLLCAKNGDAVYVVDCDSTMSPAWGQVAPLAAPQVMTDGLVDTGAVDVATDLAKMALIAVRALLDEGGLIAVGAVEHERLTVLVGEAAAQTLVTSLEQGAPDELGWARLARSWAATGHAGPSDDTPQWRVVGTAGAGRPTRPRTPYQPAPAPTLLPRRLRPQILYNHWRATVVLLVVTIVVMAVLLGVVVLEPGLLRGY